MIEKSVEEPLLRVVEEKVEPDPSLDRRERMHRAVHSDTAKALMRELIELFRGNEHGLGWDETHEAVFRHFFWKREIDMAAEKKEEANNESA